MTDERLNKVLPALRDSNGTIVIDVGKRLVSRSVRDVHADVSRLSCWFADQGVEAGHRVGIFAQNSYEWLLVDLACLARGAVSVPFDPNHQLPLAEQVERYDLRHLFVQDHSIQESSVIHPLATIGAHIDGSVPNLTPYRFARDEIYTVKFTSGTSAQIKSVGARALHFDSMARHIQSMFKISPRDKLLVVFPLSVWLQRFMVHLCMSIGCDVVISRVDRAGEVLAKERPTLMIGVPRFFEAMFNLYHARRRRDPQVSFRALWGGRMRSLWTGAAPIVGRIVEFYHEEGVPLYEGYGMTETGMIAKNYPGCLKIGSVGKPFPDKRLTFDEQGQLIVSSDSLPNRAYLIGPEPDTKVFLDDCRVATGDIGYLDREGFLFLTGRAGDAIVLANGKKVFPSTIEERIQHPELMVRCIVCGHGHAFLTSVVVARDTDPDRRRMIEEHVARINAAAPPVEQVHGLVITSEDFTLENGLLTAAGKVNRKRVFERFATELQRIYQGAARNADASRVTDALLSTRRGNALDE